MCSLIIMECSFCTVKEMWAYILSFVLSSKMEGNTILLASPGMLDGYADDLWCML